MARIERKHLNKFLYYIAALSRELVPAWICRAWLQKKLKLQGDVEYINDRVNYYNKLSKNVSLSAKAIALADVKITTRPRVYYFDSYEYLRYFDPSLKANFLFGDIVHVPDEPSIVKSRPVAGDNVNSVLLKLNKVRHFIFLNDTIDFRKKKDLLIGRSVVGQPHRIRFFEKYFDHPLCDLGQINHDKNTQWIKNKIAIEDHLSFKFILCLEGNDVASNLKWVMSSNSIAVMPKPTYETWFMEGRLIPNYHYIEIKSDYSDLEEQLTFYINNTDAALQIVKNAHSYVSQFKNNRREDIISLMVLQKYFLHTGQRNTPSR